MIMFLPQAFFILFRISSILSMELSPPEGWNALMHIHKNINEVVSAEWYLSRERTSLSEYNQFLNLLKGPDANFYACEFPARTKFIRRNFAKTFSDNLLECPDLEKFKKNFDKKYVSLALTSEHLNAPASAFGHIMMVFHDHHNVELNSSILHFSALTNNENFLRYTANGLIGIFSGFYFYEPFFKKLNEYSDIEQRSIYFHKLILTEEQRDFLILHLYELKKARFKYFFATKNCGYQINNLLNLVYSQVEDVPSLYFLPRDVLDKQRKHLTYEYTIFPLAKRAEHAIKALNSNELSNFSTIIEQGETPIPTSSEATKKALYIYNKYLFRNKRIITYQFDNINELSINDPNEDFLEKNDSPINHSPPRKINFGFQKSSRVTNFILSYRPFLLEASDFQNYKEDDSVFNFLKTELRFNNNDLLLNRLDLLDIKQARSTYPYFRDFSWFLNFSFNRENLNDSLSLSQALGIGQSFDLGLKFSYFLGAGFDLEKIRKGRPYLLGQLNSHYYFYQNNKILYQGKFKYYKNHFFETHNVSIIKSLKNFDLYAGYIFEIENKVTAGMYYHF